MMEKVKLYGWKRFIQFVVGELKVRYINRFLLGSYSQSKEDLVLDRLTGYKSKGMYIDVGAYDPIRFSNTMRFYLRGWQGINIEPNTDYWSKFVTKRPRDINLNIGIGRKTGIFTYYAMDPGALSTFSKRQADKYVAEGFSLLKKKNVQVYTLKSIFAKYTTGKRIDFLSLDVEGFEMGVLKSNNWKLYRPLYLCIENIEESDTSARTTQRKQTIGDYLQTQGYQMIFDNGLNFIYKDIHHE